MIERLIWRPDERQIVPNGGAPGHIFRTISMRVVRFYGRASKVEPLKNRANGSRDEILASVRGGRNSRRASSVHNLYCQQAPGCLGNDSLLLFEKGHDRRPGEDAAYFTSHSRRSTYRRRVHDACPASAQRNRKSTADRPVHHFRRIPPCAPVRAKCRTHTEDQACGRATCPAAGSTRAAGTSTAHGELLGFVPD